jgi:hypothetical protein
LSIRFLKEAGLQIVVQGTILSRDSVFVPICKIRVTSWII